MHDHENLLTGVSMHLVPESPRAIQSPAVRRRRRGLSHGRRSTGRDADAHVAAPPERTPPSGSAGGGRSVEIWLTLCSCLLLFLLAVSLHPEVLTCLYILPSVMFLCSRKQSVTGTASHRCRQGMSQRCCFRYSLVIILITVLIQTEIAVIKEQDYPTFCACRSIIIPWFRVGAHDYHEHGMQHEESVSSN